MELRRYISSDIEAIARLFYDTVHTVNAKDYTEEQLNVWATGNLNIDEWDKSFMEHYTIVAVDDDIIVGFGDMDSSGYLDRLYVHKDYQGRGIATAICDMLEKEVNTTEITVHASITARPFFEKRGYKVVREQNVERSNVCLKNYIMKMALTNPGKASLSAQL